MWRPFTVLLVTAVLLALTTALSCARCTPEDIAKCGLKEPSWFGCYPKGLQTLPCHCCKSCRSGLGEPCGGYWGGRGKCAPYLYCKPNPDQPITGILRRDLMEGTCVYKESTSSPRGSEDAMWKEAVRPSA